MDYLAMSQDLVLDSKTRYPRSTSETLETALNAMEVASDAIKAELNLRASEVADDRIAQATGSLI